MEFLSPNRRAAPRPAAPKGSPMRLAVLICAGLATAAAPATPALSQMMMMSGPNPFAPVRLAPFQVGDAFCLGRTGNDMAAMAGLFTADLAAAIAGAWARNDAIAASAPGDKPPLGDGVPWSTYPDYAADCRAYPLTETVREDDGEALVEVNYHFAQFPNADYSDVLMMKLVHEGDHGALAWRIDDIRYEESEETLRAALIALFESF